jgi:hypothetical protein
LVLSGGASVGALQVSMRRALYERGVTAPRCRCDAVETIASRDDDGDWTCSRCGRLVGAVPDLQLVESLK